MGRSRAKGILLLGVLGTAVSAILVRYSQAPSLVTATYRLGWTVLLLLPAALLRGGSGVETGYPAGRGAVCPERCVSGPSLCTLV